MAMEIMKLTTVGGSQVEINEKGEITIDVSGERISYKGNLTLELLRAIRHGELYLPHTTVLEIKSIEQNFSDDLIDKIGMEEKKHVELNDTLTGVAISAIPAFAASVAEAVTTVSRLAQEGESQVSEFLQSLPFPLLFEVFQNAPEPIRAILVPFLFIGGGIVGGGALLGKGANKLRYFSRSVQLEKEFDNAEGVDINDVMDSFKESSKNRTAVSAYLDTKERFATL